MNQKSSSLFLLSVFENSAPTHAHTLTHTHAHTHALTHTHTPTHAHPQSNKLFIELWNPKTLTRNVIRFSPQKNVQWKTRRMWERVRVRKWESLWVERVRERVRERERKLLMWFLVLKVEFGGSVALANIISRSGSLWPSSNFFSRSLSLSLSLSGSLSLSLSSTHSPLHSHSHSLCVTDAHTFFLRKHFSSQTSPPTYFFGYRQLSSHYNLKTSHLSLSCTHTHTHTCAHMHTHSWSHTCTQTHTHVILPV